MKKATWTFSPCLFFFLVMSKREKKPAICNFVFYVGNISATSLFPFSADICTSKSFSPTHAYIHYMGHLMRYSKHNKKKCKTYQQLKNLLFLLIQDGICLSDLAPYSYASYMFVFPNIYFFVSPSYFTVVISMYDIYYIVSSLRYEKGIWEDPSHFHRGEGGISNSLNVFAKPIGMKWRYS